MNIKKRIEELQEELSLKKDLPFTSGRIKKELERLWIRHNKLSKLIKNF